MLAIKNEKKISITLPKKKPITKINKILVKNQLLPKKKPAVNKAKEKLAEQKIKKLEISKKNIEKEKVEEISVSRTLTGEFILPIKKPVTY